MTRPKVYGVGYSGKKLNDLVRLSRRLDAILVDIRFSPWSRNPQFQPKSLIQAFGPDYKYLRALGNRNYRGGSIAIDNYAEGKAWLLQQERDVILMCMCGDPKHCHRTTVLRMLAEDGFKTRELDGPPDPEPEQLSLL